MATIEDEGQRGVTSNYVPEDLEPFDVLGWDMPEKRTPKFEDPDYLTLIVLYQRCRHIWKII